MWKRLYLSWAVTLTLGTLGCSSEPAAKESAVQATAPERACTMLCEKLGSCDALLGQSVEACVSGCAAAASGEAPDCAVSDAQAAACIDALGGLGCKQISSSQVPAACNWCDDTRGRGAAGSTAAPAGMGCAKLRTCCGELAAADQQSLCSMVAAMKNDSLCVAVLPGYQSAGACH